MLKAELFEQLTVALAPHEAKVATIDLNGDFSGYSMHVTVTPSDRLLLASMLIIKQWKSNWKVPDDRDLCADEIEQLIAKIEDSWTRSTFSRRDEIFNQQTFMRDTKDIVVNVLHRIKLGL